MNEHDSRINDLSLDRFYIFLKFYNNILYFIFPLKCQNGIIFGFFISQNPEKEVLYYHNLWHLVTNLANRPITLTLTVTCYISLEMSNNIIFRFLIPCYIPKPSKKVIYDNLWSLVTK